MLRCGECKTPFPVYSALKDHFRTNHVRKYVAICLWLGPERIESRWLDDYWFYELRFTRRQRLNQAVEYDEIDEKMAI
jgi:hypothetical protein